MLNGVCVFDHDDTTVLDGYFETSLDMTIQKCLSTCRSKGFQYAGLQWQTEVIPGSLRLVSEHFLSAIAEMSLRRDSNGHGQINAIKNVVAILIRFVVDREQ